MKERLVYTIACGRNNKRQTMERVIYDILSYSGMDRLYDLSNPNPKSFKPTLKWMFKDE